MDKKYICEFCKTPYDRPFDRAQCEMACYNRIQIEEEKAAQARKEQEKKDRYDAIVAKLKEVDKMILEYHKEFGCLTIKLPSTLRGFDDNFGTVPDLFKTWF